MAAVNITPALFIICYNFLLNLWSVRIQKKLRKEKNYCLFATKTYSCSTLKYLLSLFKKKKQNTIKQIVPVDAAAIDKTAVVIILKQDDMIQCSRVLLHFWDVPQQQANKKYQKINDRKDT